MSADNATKDNAPESAGIKEAELFKQIADDADRKPGGVMQATGVILCLAASGFRFEWGVERQLTSLEFVAIFLGGIALLALGALVTLSRERLSKVERFELQVIDYQQEMLRAAAAISPERRAAANGDPDTGGRRQGGGTAPSPGSRPWVPPELPGSQSATGGRIRKFFSGWFL